jgi:uncharacterized protein
MTIPLPTKDFARKPAPDAVQLQGLLGSRFQGSRTNRLHHQEEDHLLWPFHEHCQIGYVPAGTLRPGIRGDWPGEFIGTWLDAAIHSAWNANDAALRAKVDAMVQDWLSTQAEDGYLGTYEEKDRWKAWDIWVQAHNIIGLYSYYRWTGKQDILDAMVRMVDRVLVDFGPGKRAVRETGPHVGMASSAFLEPLMWIYWETGNTRYLDFAKWLVEEDWEGPGGAQIISTLLSGKGVADCGNSKGIEMLLDFAGLLELYRTTGEERYLKTIDLAWEDIVAHHLYITGSASTGEYFPKDFVLRNEGVYMIGETCVSMGWMYLNFSLARLTGNAKYIDMAEQTLYNHLLGAQSPDGRNWIYYLGLRDSKRYRWHTDPECCPSKGVRAIALLPTHAYFLTDNSIMVNLYDRSSIDFSLPDGSRVKLITETDYPFDGKIQITTQAEKPVDFNLRLRVPGWCAGFTVALNGSSYPLEIDSSGYLNAARNWAPGDTITLEFEMPVRVVTDAFGNAGRVALTRGPLVYAADQSYLPAGTLLDEVTLALDPTDPARNIRTIRNEADGSVHLLVQRVLPCPQATAELWREKERYKVLSAPTAVATAVGTAEDVELVPFFDAGNRDPRNYCEGIQPNNEPVTHITFQVWLPYQFKE